MDNYPEQMRRLSAEIEKKLGSIGHDDRAVLIMAPFRGSAAMIGVRRFVDTLPPRTKDEVEARAAAFAAPEADRRGEQWDRMLGGRFRAPHNTVSSQGLSVGSAKNRNRTEFDLAKGGVLLLDEIDEFSRLALEDLARRWRAEDDVLVVAIFYVDPKNSPGAAASRLERAKRFSEMFDPVVIDATDTSRGGDAMQANEATGVSAADLADDYRRRAKSERDAGGSIEIDMELPMVSIRRSDGAEYFREDWQADELLDEAKRTILVDFDGRISLDDYLLAAAQSW